MQSNPCHPYPDGIDDAAVVRPDVQLKNKVPCKHCRMARLLVIMILNRVRPEKRPLIHLQGTKIFRRMKARRMVKIDKCTGHTGSDPSAT